MEDMSFVFQRKEVKFRVTDSQREAFLKLTSEYMHPDMYGESTIMSLYFDTDSFQLLRRSAEHPLYKEKLRFRSYGVPNDASVVFLEIKKKFDGIVYKRRISLPYHDYRTFADGDVTALPDTQIGREIAYFTGHYPTLSPKVLVCYERSAFFANDDATTRVTFDRNIRYRFSDLSPDKGADGKSIFEEGTDILELKFYCFVPKYISDALTELDIKPFSFSKCGTAYNEEILRRINNA